MNHASPKFLSVLLASLMLWCPATWGDDVDPVYETLEAAGDGFPIHITYLPVTEDMYPNNTMDQAPVVVMLHGTDGSRLFWDRASRPNTQGGLPFAEAVNALGIAVVTVDLRQHGESIVEGQEQTLRPVDYPKMVAGDLVAVKKFIFDEHQAHRLNMNKTGIIAMEMSAPLALAFATEDWRTLPFRDGPGGSFGTPRGQDVRSLIVISPDQSAGTINNNRSINFLKDPAFDISFMFIAGAEDDIDDGTAEGLYDLVARQNSENCILLEPMTNARGEDLFLNNSARIEPEILRFLDENLKTVESEWINRLSRYDQDEEND
jgi:pimeloyl-ACP methyl ester carboxylesterase